MLKRDPVDITQELQPKKTLYKSYSKFLDEIPHRLKEFRHRDCGFPAKYPKYTNCLTQFQWEDEFLLWAYESVCNVIPWKTGDFFYKTSPEGPWLPFKNGSEKSATMSLALLREHIFGKIILGYKRKSNVLSTVGFIGRGSDLGHSLDSVKAFLKMVANKKETFSLKPSLMYTQGDRAIGFYNFDEYYPQAMYNENIFQGFSLAHVELINNSSDIQTFPFGAGFKLLNPETYEEIPLQEHDTPWVNIINAKKHFHVYPRLQSLVKRSYYKTLRKQGEYKYSNVFITPEGLPPQKKQHSRRTDQELLGIPEIAIKKYFANAEIPYDELYLITLAIKKSPEYINLPKHKDLSLERTKELALRDSIYAYCLFSQALNQVYKNTDSTGTVIPQLKKSTHYKDPFTYFMPSVIMRKMNQRYAHSFNNVFLPLFTSVTIDYSNSSVNAHCAGYDLKKFALIKMNVILAMRDVYMKVFPDNQTKIINGKYRTISLESREVRWYKEKYFEYAKKLCQKFSTLSSPCVYSDLLDHDHLFDMFMKCGGRLEFISVTALTESLNNQIKLTLNNHQSISDSSNTIYINNTCILRHSQKSLSSTIRLNILKKRRVALKKKVAKKLTFRRTLYHSLSEELQQDVSRGYVYLGDGFLRIKTKVSP